VVGGLAAVPMFARPAHAGRSHWRGWGGYGYGMRRSGFRRGFGGYGGYGGFGGYRGFGGYGTGIYNRGYMGAPFGGGLYSPYGGYGGMGGYGGYGYGIPILKREKPRAIDALSMLEC